MKKIYLNLKKVKKALVNLYNIEKNIEKNILIKDYEKSLLELDIKNKLSYDIKKSPQIIVSLTTYSKRIYDVHLVIESLFRQTLMPNKIVLWLSEEEFNEKNIPIFLKKLQKKGLEIRFCEDLKSYKKIIPTLRMYPEDIIITVDDDFLYSYDLIEKLYSEHQKNPDNIVCTRAHQYIINNNELLPYNKWNMGCMNLEKNIFLTSGGGTLFPAKCFSNNFYDIEKIFKLCPTADDVWINAMILENNKKIVQVKDHKKWSEKNILLEENQDIGLYNLNVEKNRNDTQIKNVFDYYNLWEKLKNEE